MNCVCGHNWFLHPPQPYAGQQARPCLYQRSRHTGWCACEDFEPKEEIVVTRRDWKEVALVAAMILTSAIPLAIVIMIAVRGGC
jgi:hypothetical protein